MSVNTMPDSITVSNGRQFRQIPLADLADAVQNGFYRPLDRGQTIVGNDEFQFEIPIVNLPNAVEDGFRDLLAAEQASTPDLAHLVTESLTQAEQEEEQARRHAEQELAETEGWRWYVLWLRMWLEARRSVLIRQLRGNGISAAVHVALLLLLASLFMKIDEEPKGIVLKASPASEEMVEEVVIEPTPLEITEPTEPTEEVTPQETLAVAEAVTAPDFLAGVSGDAVKPPAEPVAPPAAAKKPVKRTTFFGKKVMAINYVFVIDNSNSMTRGRFETALNELMIAVNQLTAKQRFYVIFYSDTAYPMLHPRPATQLVPATPQNKEALRYWLDTVQLCLKTNGKQAIQAAFNLQPDVIFVLGDGAFTDKAAEHFASMPQKRIPLHTLGMDVKEQDAASFRLLAEANGGTYRDVTVSPAAVAMAKANPRPRNSVRGEIWGITLKPAVKLK